MNRRWSRFWRWIVVLGASGTVLQVGGIGFTRNGLGGNCQPRNFFTNGALTSVDFCYLLDCQNGFLGGAIQPCGNPNVLGDELLVDCPQPVVVTATAAQTTTTTPPGQGT